ncbi:MAG: ParB N-terminal domain-containing protein [Deltaproteobacteria bacterium]|nr:ParB N-terminal domain-containing protein [Deltaproteobacteria bacterium]
MNHIAPVHEPTIRPIALDRLSVAPENVRKTPPDAAAEAELKASIAGHGLLGNLVVRSEGPGGGYAVVAGGRRFAALKALAADGVLDTAHPVPCLVVDSTAESSELSLAENVIRIAMHPADQVTAFTKLAESGVTVAAIAARFGISEPLVEQRLRLGNAASELLDAYRADEIDLETLKAFAVTTDHRRQMAVWEHVANQGYRPTPWEVKRLLTEERIPANSAMARFVGVDAYEAAGGPVLRDLFAAEDQSGIWLDDPVLLQKLAMEKLDETVKELATRWRWATAVPEVDWTSLARYGRIQPEPAAPTDEETAELERLRTREDELANLDEDDWTEELGEEACAIETRTGEINAAIEARETYRAEDYAIAGAIATIGWDGELQVIGGLVRPEDMPKPADSGDSAGGDAGDGHGDDATGSVRFQGPSISQPIASPPDPQAEARKQVGVGIGLADDLCSIRTALVKAHLGNDFEAAFDLMLFQFGRAVFTRGYKDHALDIAIRETPDRPTMRMNDQDFGAWSPGEAMLADRSSLPLDWLTIEDDGESFTALRALPEADKQALFAASVARTGKGQLAFEPQARPELEATVARLDIDFAGQVRPCADMMWSRINKGRILDIARETLGPTWVSARAKSKKAALAKAMEEAFAAGSPPLGITADAHAAALAWTPPGFAAFDADRARIEDAGAETAAPAEASDSAADHGPSPEPEGAGTEQVEPESADAPADPSRPVSAAKSIEALGAPVATNGNGNGGTASAGDETDPTAGDDDRTAEAEAAGTPTPPEIVSHAGRVNGYHQGDIPEFLRRV